MIFFYLNLILQMIMIQRHGNVNFQIQVVIRHNYEIFKGIIFFFEYCGMGTCKYVSLFLRVSHFSRFE